MDSLVESLRTMQDPGSWISAFNFVRFVAGLGLAVFFLGVIFLLYLYTKRLAEGLGEERTTQRAHKASRVVYTKVSPELADIQGYVRMQRLLDELDTMKTNRFVQERRARVVALMDEALAHRDLDQLTTVDWALDELEAEVRGRIAARKQGVEEAALLP